MRHRKAGFKLGRTRTHRQAMLRNMAASLFEHGQIVTSVPKAKALQPMVEKIITKAKKGDLHSRRQVIAILGRDRKAFDWLYTPKNADEAAKQRVADQRERTEKFFDIPSDDQVERNRYGELRKAPKLVRHIFENVAPRFEDRQGGYTRIVRIGYHRLGDATEMCVIQFVGAEEGPEIGGNPSRRRRQADKRSAYNAKLRKERGGDKAAATATAEPKSEESEGSGESSES
ncbi:MAG: 50S ribosomal protein L17 [Phycisphaera sp.]|nr:MAG: 50S ribosomal protein L17 [Phycisphaera sp.]